MVPQVAYTAVLVFGLALATAVAAAMFGIDADFQTRNAPVENGVCIGRA